MAGRNDTRPEAEQVLREVYRKMPFAAKWWQMGVLYRTAKVLHAMGVRQRNPAATDEMIREEWRIAALGAELAQKVKEARRGSQR